MSFWGNLGSSLLQQNGNTGSGTPKISENTTDTAVVQVMTKVEGYIGIVRTVFLSICALVVVLFAIYVGWKMAKAEEDQKRTEAKQQLIYSIIGILSIVIFVVLFRAVIPLLGAKQGLNAEELKKQSTGLSHEEIDSLASVFSTYQVVQKVVATVLNVIGTVAIVFAVYVGWQLMKAEEQSKRDQAKKQLLFTVIGVVGIVLINFIAQAVIGSLQSKIFDKTLKGS